MSAMEKLFAQIFERRNWIVDQVRHQTRLFDQHLASTLLIDGVAPPPWLLRSQPSSVPKEFRREELITELLEPQLQFSVPYSIGHCPVYDKPVLTVDTRGFPADLCAYLGTLQETGEASSKLPLLHENPKHDTSFVLNGALEADPNIRSPQHQRDMIISEYYHDLDQSLARVQRSKSRQKALELRNSAKASGNCLRQKDPIVNPSRSAVSGVAPQLSENVFSAELVKPSHASSHINSTKETQMVYFNSKEKGSKTSSGRAMRSLVSGSCPNGLLEMDAPCSIDLEVQRQSEGDRGDSSRKEKESNIRCREITRPHKSTENCPMNEALKSNSSFPVGKISGMDKLMQPVSQVDNSVELNGSGSIHGLESRDCQINGHQTTVDCGEISQLRCYSHQPNREELPGLEMSSDPGDVKMAGSSGKPVQSPQDDDCGNGNALVTDNFLFSGCSVNQLGSTHSDQLITSSTHNLPKAHSTTPNALSNLCNNFDPEKCATDAAQSSVAFEKPPEGSPFGIPSNIDPADLNNVPEALASSLCSDSNIHLKPKQLDFDDAGENGCCLNNVPGAVLEESVEDTVQGKGLDTSWKQEKEL
ncbi:uncharacterized protein LOC125313916 isoform X1 [Rhodamnia argentea]|uniref:Uncharacterized protein LOC125313916 isoform X1 n=1 Tax=Rhodamnia argentea TaxID=178133 RepID=A0ABM3H3B8_9MYRT|nr:uncharacterized protein LOC125313916 isoform X1 [Rhodamnia argentea]